MIDFNAAEIVILAALAVIIFGPEKLPELARKAARVLAYVRNIANDAQGRLRAELGPEFADVDLAGLNPKALVNKHLLAPVQDEVSQLASHVSPAGETAGPAAADAADRPAAAGPVPGPASTAPFDPEAT